MIACTSSCRSRSSLSNVSPSITGMLMSSSMRSMSGSADSAVSASPPWCAKRNSNSSSRIWARKRCRIKSSKSGSSSTARILAEAANGLPLTQRSVQLAQTNSQNVEVDRLGHKISCPILGGAPPSFIVSISGQHHHRELGSPLLDLPQERQAVHSGHIDVRQDHDPLRLDFAGKTLQRFRSGKRKIQDINALPRLATKLLPKQDRDVGLVIDNQDANRHDLATHAEGFNAALAPRPRGRQTVNSVNSPTLLATSIVPPCCLVTMSWLIESPSPVPSPLGFVVKKGWNSLFLISSGMPLPLSRTRTSTASPISREVTVKVGLNAPSFASRRRLFAA